MTPHEIRARLLHAAAVAVYLRDANRHVEADRWQKIAERCKALLEPMPVYGPKAAA